MDSIDRTYDRYGVRTVEYDSGDRTHQHDADREWTYVVAGGLLMALGGWFIYQGARSRPARPFALPGRLSGSRESTGLHLTESVIVNRPAAQLYGFWRDFENLPRVMTHLEEVTTLSDTRSRWVAKGPVGIEVSWEAVVTDDRPNESIAWRSEPDSQVPTEGAVSFSPRGEGTEIKVSLTYHPPGGALGGAIARLFGEAPSQQIREDLQRFKADAESGTLSLIGASS